MIDTIRYDTIEEINVYLLAYTHCDMKRDVFYNHQKITTHWQSFLVVISTETKISTETPK